MTDQTTDQAGNPAPSHPLSLNHEALTTLIAENMGGALICGRAWSAWGIGTMAEGDFSEASESDIPGEIADAILAAAGAHEICAAVPAPFVPEVEQLRVVVDNAVSLAEAMQADAGAAPAVQAAARAIPVESCKACPHCVGRIECAKAGRKFDGGRPDAPPAWCPLPALAAAPVAPQAAPKLCPVCDSEWHAEGCELGQEVSRRLTAEYDAARLRTANAAMLALAEAMQADAGAAPAVQAVAPQVALPVTLADVLDALNCFNRPKPNEDDGPWVEGHYIRVDHLPAFINIIAKAWFSAAPVAQPLTPPFDFAAHLRRQAEFSSRTFGPGARVEGVTDHIAKELIEVRDSGGALAEWIDVVILGLDGCWRSGATPDEIIGAMVAKQTKNEGRSWPDWRSADPDKAIEHDRGADAGKEGGAA